MKFGMMLPVAAIVAAACATAPASKPFDIANFDSLKPGVTTKAEALEILGAPTRHGSSLNNHTTLNYDYRGGAFMVVALFDQQDVFVRYRMYTDSNP